MATALLGGVSEQRDLPGQPVALHKFDDRAALRAFQQAQAEEDAGSSGCVESYFAAARLTASDFEYSDSPAGMLHHESLSGFLRTAQRFGRYDPLNGISVHGRHGESVVPISYEGFAWTARDFCELRCADEFSDHDLRNHYVVRGRGVGLVVVRRSPPGSAFFLPQHPFSATAILARRPYDVPCAAAESEFCLRFCNPRVYDSIDVDGFQQPLTRNLTAPFGFLYQTTSRPWLEGFIDPGGSAASPKLIMLEPPHAGKIPVVLIHGLLSDPYTWADVINELRTRNEIETRFQFWAFRYPTGDAILGSAARLREYLRAARDLCDPEHADPALDQMVLVGHSLGGLVAQLQVADSRNLVWEQFATRPLDDFRAPPELKNLLQSTFFFHASPSVTRVVFIGTPHQGSSWSRRLVGRISSSLVQENSARDRQFDQLVAANRDYIREEFTRRLPTSIDMLEPDSPLLATLPRLPTAPCLQTHSIIGYSRGGVIHAPSDGVVPVSSARYPHDVSEILVAADHMELHRDPVTIDELHRILLEHAALAEAMPAGIGR